MTLTQWTLAILDLGSNSEETSANSELADVACPSSQDCANYVFKIVAQLSESCAHLFLSSSSLLLSFFLFSNSTKNYEPRNAFWAAPIDCWAGTNVGSGNKGRIVFVDLAVEMG